jgi:hypothetical protein
MRIKTENAIDKASPMSIKNAGTGKKKIERIAIMPPANPMSRALLRSPSPDPADKTPTLPSSLVRDPGEFVGGALRGDAAADGRALKGGQKIAA